VAFDPLGPLPTGTTLLEASAGTGKTWTIGALVTRYVAEGAVSLPQMLVVTFGRAASQELRERVRLHLVTAERALADPTVAAGHDDAVIRGLAAAPAIEVATRRGRIVRALADFDAATIATTHQFCQQVLAGLGVAGDSEPDATLVEDLTDLVGEITDDLYVRAFAKSTQPPRFSRKEAQELAQAVVSDPQAGLEPQDAAASSDPYWRRWFGEQVRIELDRRKRRRGVLSFDDLLGRVADALGTGDPAARQRLRERWSLVLVDEFQDTDPVQWEVLQRAFVGVATVVLVGDPKQAVYAFRGGDVVTYLAAARTAGTAATLGRNWRSDADLLASLEVLLDGVELGDPQIVVRPVSAVHTSARLTGAPHPAPVRLRMVHRRDLVRSGVPAVDVARDWVARDLAADIAELLSSGARYDGRPLGPGDLGVLVNTHPQAALIREALQAKNIAAVVAGPGSVFSTPAGDAWSTLLEAMEQPGRTTLVRAAALTPFLGWTPEALDAAGEAGTDEISGLIRRWATLLTDRGVAAVLEASTAERGLWARVLRRPDGPRLLTDLRHIGQALQAIAVRDRLGPAALLEWLRRRRAETAGDRTDERARRLDSDAEAVQIATLHASKGLEYPVVYLPFAWDRWIPGKAPARLHDDDGRRLLDIGGAGSPGYPQREKQAAREAAGESLRLLYVGLTRAQSQVVTWWAATKNTPAAALHRVLFARELGTGQVADLGTQPTDERAATVLAEWSRRGAFALEDARPTHPGPGSATPAGTAPVSVARFTRTLDLSWHRASYTSMTAGLGHGPADVGSEPETFGTDDETMAVTADAIEPGRIGPPAGWPTSPMTDLPGGTTFGSLVHAVLENVDTAAADLPAELLTRCIEEVGTRPRGSGAFPFTAADLAAGLLPVLRTPLGPMADQISLADIAPTDRLAELTFELPLAGGDTPSGPGTLPSITLGAVGALLRRHLPLDDPLVDYPDRLTAPELARAPVRGYLTGSLDAVLRLAGPRYLVVDYKTNRLGDPDAETISTWDYRPQALAAAMMDAHYPLQALLYSVALHRFLRWRQPGYTPEQHLGGALYLFVRGMAGPQTPTVGEVPAGVFGWRPPDALVTDLSALLDRGVR
jgi:exodeoxyribonuclease V beta subunit